MAKTSQERFPFFVFSLNVLNLVCSVPLSFVFIDLNEQYVKSLGLDSCPNFLKGNIGIHS